MIIGFESLGEDQNYEVCVIGSGPAGITLATSLARSGTNVLLLEAGDMFLTDESQQNYKAAVIGDPYFELDFARLRFFGGTSGHWSGWCRALDEIAFEPKEGFDLAQWPIRKADLDPYAGAADAILEIPAAEPDREIPGAAIKKISFRFSPPVLFGEKYRDEILRSDRIALCLNANVQSLETDGDRISGIEVSDYSGKKRRVSANRYVLACGGIENSRILLYSNAKSGNAVIKSDRALGRYFLEHPHFTLGDILYDREPADEEFYSLTATAQRSLGILGCGLRVQPILYAGTKKLIADIACVAPGLSEWAFRQAGRRLACGARLRAAWEQEPRAENRIALSETATDFFGAPQAVLHWSKSQQDLRTVREAAMHFGRHLASADIGRVRLRKWVLGEEDYPDNDELAGYHHMGGTRMSRTRADGVVDADLKAWGQQNLYVCGSSVFPSGGHANPTYTIVQLALRLADHLSRSSG